jgi:hypothetical protein
MAAPAAVAARPFTACFLGPGISQVGADRASVVRCRRSLLIASGYCRCCQPSAASFLVWDGRLLWVTALKDASERMSEALWGQG